MLKNEMNYATNLYGIPDILTMVSIFLKFKEIAACGMIVHKSTIEEQETILWHSYTKKEFNSLKH